MSNNHITCLIINRRNVRGRIDIGLGHKQIIIITTTSIRLSSCDSGIHCHATELTFLSHFLKVMKESSRALIHTWTIVTMLLTPLTLLIICLTPTSSCIFEIRSLFKVHSAILSKREFPAEIILESVLATIIRSASRSIVSTTWITSPI